MDKRPVALGGGFVNIKKDSKNFNELNIFYKENYKFISLRNQDLIDFCFF